MTSLERVILWTFAICGFWAFLGFHLHVFHN